jgi:glutathione S-transferase
MITIHTFGWVPPFAQGLVRDMRVRWALEEAGLAYGVRPIDADTQQAPDYRALQPFGQAPVYEEDGLSLFESGAIVLHIGETSEALLPRNRAGKARADTWLLCALNTMEIVIQELAEIDLFTPDDDWAKERRPLVEAMVRKRLAELAAWLGDRKYLEDRFTAGDLMMTTVLQILRHTDLVENEPVLAAYVQRCTARPAYQRAYEAHMAAFRKKAS